ncbi:MAG: hypothetical protein KHZ06_05445 [Blautia sp.]|jgi:hypothetical protein|uniref:hypothetical protein n=2 Tax=Lachnospirales TaxID=3085636 RepID=UPI00156E71A7|nr:MULTISPECIES: hypothetical protein [Blautia]MBS5122318.1 hypothetical protein [Blautia sp.]NSG82177.1 hypothetical protein [Blautia schinkii]NSK25820.1 hypothetical protein [Blautia schinkii]NSK31772.1 hypothetical protein [Blautia schinkii]NSK49232.1 hypothetical protein [Blautia schinkii]
MMSENSNFDVNVERIYDNLELLEKGHVYELQKTPGIPKCATLASRIRDDVDVIVKALDEKEDMEATDEEQFNLLAKLLGGLYAEFSSLAKKQPDALTNAFKTSRVNRVLSPLKQIMASEDSTQYLDLLQEADDGQANGKGRSTYSDAVIIMSQYKTACDEFRLKYFNKGWDMLWQR